MNTDVKNHAQNHAKYPDLKNEDTAKECWLCKGYGYLRSHCDAPDRICPACQGFGKAD